MSSTSEKSSSRQNLWAHCSFNILEFNCAWNNKTILLKDFDPHICCLDFDLFLSWTFYGVDFGPSISIVRWILCYCSSKIVIWYVHELLNFFKLFKFIILGLFCSSFWSTGEKTVLLIVSLQHVFFLFCFFFFCLVEQCDHHYYLQYCPIQVKMSRVGQYRISLLFSMANCLFTKTYIMRDE